MYNEVFLPSLKKVEPSSKITNIEIDFEGTGGIRTKGWYEAGWKKIEVIEKASKINNNEVIALFDVDIIFLRPFCNEVFKLIKDKDILIQRHYETGDKFNIGVVFLRCNKNVNNYLKFVLKQRKKEDTWDEEIIDKTMKESGLRFGFLPLAFSNESNNGFREDAYLYHANELGNTIFSSSVEKKYKKLKKLYNKYYLNSGLFGSALKK